MSPSDIVIATLFYQFSLYVCVRLARRGFTLGELGVVCNAATALFMETVNLTRMKVSLPLGFARSSVPGLTLLDSSTSYTIYQDISPSDPAHDVPTSPDPRLTLGRIPPVPITLPISSFGSKTRTSPSVPPRETRSPPPTRSGVLRRIRHRLRWTGWVLDEVVS